jgi:hypothetical protein
MSFGLTRRKSYILLLFLFSPAIADEVKMDKITVLDGGFQVLRVINESDQLAKAQEQWHSLIPIDELPNTNWTHKLDIKSDFVGGRWLYNKEGYIAKLNKQLEPKYKVSDVKLFNETYLDP